jgi:hypothetical protein
MGTKINFHANCASCKRGENKVGADVFVSGRIRSRDSDKMMPYRAYLCDDHLQLLKDDGRDDALTVTDLNLDRITARETAFRTFAELCQKHHNPTLRHQLLRGAYNDHMAKQSLPHRAYA